VAKIKKVNVLKEVLKFITNRQLITFVVVSLSFYLLLARLFNLQIVNGQRDSSLTTIRQTVSLATKRGNIYDRLGRPLAINETKYVIQMDASQTEMNPDMMRDLITMLERCGETIVDQLPISQEEPYLFEFSRISTNEYRWKPDMDFPNEKYDPQNPDAIVHPRKDAEESFYYLREMFKLDESLSNTEARKILNLCGMLYMQRYRSLEPVIIAYDVKPETVAILKEENLKYKGFTAVEESVRVYPEGDNFAHIVGYIGYIDAENYEKNKDKGYTVDDVIGQTGIEKAYESYLRGVAGTADVELNASNKIVQYLPDFTPSQPGNDVFLTLDRDLQVACYDIMEDTLKLSLMAQLRGDGGAASKVTLPQLFASMSRSSVFSLTPIMATTDDEESAQAAAKRAILRVSPEADLQADNGADAIREAMGKAVEEGILSPATMLRLMIEQEIVSGSSELVESLMKNKANVLQEVLAKLESGEITPQMTALDPSTGSIVVVDVSNGKVLAAIGYPSFDPNKRAYNRDSQYYLKLMNDDTMPQINRPFQEQRAPGSTLKMVTAITALEYGVINPETRIYDGHTFVGGQGRGVSCWSASSHGFINVSEALEVSCNYFFSDAAFRMGSVARGTRLESVLKMNEYMKYFGLSEKTGVEIGEAEANISSPEFKRTLVSLYNKTPTNYDLEWQDYDTISTAIGQGFNNYTPAAMAKYVMTLANRGDRYEMHLVDSVKSAMGDLVSLTRPKLEERGVEISDSTWEAVYKGMLLVTEGPKGTGRSVFAGLPVRVAGKTGTAQETAGLHDHSSFGGFAPFENPEIAIYVTIPFGDTKAYTSIASRAARRVLAEYFAMDFEPQLASAENVLAR
jgi:cell division protein FtsI/penicillin-binding protein 2